ncbi:hypothetical protein AVEN_101431-1 [Araneus ventricosus]|uniref:Uncharacterized protein n=1 Tax=Araneus ventricosus TaxID=182803 RepID=A0A4Y2CV40_ARAVE|nr:hypothetical protein AVEN_101431-1 [Araneus ventricosus]
MPSIPGAFPDGRCSITAETSWGRMEDQVAVLRWLDCNLLECQGKGKSGPRCFVLPLADFPLGLRLSSTGFEMGKPIFELLHLCKYCLYCFPYGWEAALQNFLQPIFLACLKCLFYFAFSFLKTWYLACLSISGARCVLLLSALTFFL